MKPTRVYLTSESPTLQPLQEAAKLIAVQKGCDPFRVPWPQWLPSESGEEVEKYEDELWVCQKQFRQEIQTCDLFVAIVDDKYGKIQLDSPDGMNGMSAMHFELQEVSRLSEHRPRCWVFAYDTEKEPAVQRMLSDVNGRVIDFDAEKQFRSLFSTKLTEYRQDALTQYLAGLQRVKFTVTCSDEKGLIARVTQVVRDLGGSIARGTQTTRGVKAILHFVAEWTREACPELNEIKGALQFALPENGVEIEEQGFFSGAPEIESLLNLAVTFVDQPGIADHVFSTFKEDQSVLSSQIETFLSGGLMLGRIEFSLDGDGIPPQGVSVLAEKLRKLPGVLHVDSTVRRGRFWK